MYFRILIPTGNTRGPVFTEAMLKTLHAADRKREGVTFRIDSHRGETCLGIEVPRSLKDVVLTDLQDSYPGLNVQQSEPPPRSEFELTVELRKHPDVFELKTFEAFTDDTNRGDFVDPLAGILTAMQSGRSGRLGFSIELNVRPATRRRLKTAKRIRQVLDGEFRWKFVRSAYLWLAYSRYPFLRFGSGLVGRLLTRRVRHAQNDSETAADGVFECRIVVRVIATCNAPEIANKRLRDIVGAFSRYATDAELTVYNSGQRFFSLSKTEIATLWHPPTASVDSVVRVSRRNFHELEPPITLHSVPEEGSTVFGRVCFRNDKSLVRVSPDDLRRHLFVVGKTGCGKSTFLLNIVRQQMGHGRGVVLFDPHGQLAEDALQLLPKRRKNDLIYFDASRPERCAGFNPLAGPAGTDAGLIADGVLTSFKNVFGFNVGSAPRLLHIFRNCLLSLINTPHASLSSVQRLLVDELFRKSIISNVRNTAVRDFWLSEFQQWNNRDRTQFIASLQNKLGAFTTNEKLNQILAPKRHGLVLRDVMDSSKILVCNLSKGTLGHDASKLLGSLLLSSLQIAAMSRADIPESERKDCVVVIDEFHSYLAEGNQAMADALSESRKYRTSYVLSTQFLGQLDSATRAAILGNCGSIFSMSVGPDDAPLLADHFGSIVGVRELMTIPRYTGYLSLAGQESRTCFSISTLPLD